MFITKEDLEPFAVIAAVKADAMIADAESMAILAAPCLPGMLTAPEDETPEAEATRLAKLAAVKAILRGALLRWNDVGSGAVQAEQVTTGPFGIQQTVTPAARRSMFWPSEIEQLQGICSSGEKGKAYSIDTAPSDIGAHLPWCALVLGATYCSCGVDIAGEPIFEDA